MENNILTELNNTLNSLKSREYLQPTIAEFNKKIDELIAKGFSKPEAHIVVLDYITEVMRRSQKNVEKIIQRKKL